MQKREAKQVLQKIRTLHSNLGRKDNDKDAVQLTLDSLYNGNRGKSKK